MPKPPSFLDSIFSPLSVNFIFGALGDENYGGDYVDGSILGLEIL
jgi:hypothetical protein